MKQRLPLSEDIGSLECVEVSERLNRIWFEVMFLFDRRVAAAPAKDNKNHTHLNLKSCGLLWDVGENQNVGKPLISGDLRLTEVFFNPQSGRIYLSVLASLPRPLSRIIWNTATLIDRHVVYCVCSWTWERTWLQVINWSVITSKVVIHNFL